ncbi:TPA: hypothetical protein DEP94_02500 [Candidatus Nomurabacteria bacterium]|nr:hypothetical protein [Candidatus Nomurabacteria bacterium]
MKIYVGCALTHASEEFKRAVDILKIALREDGHFVFDFLGLVAGTAEDVYVWDIHNCVAKCDVFIALVDHPSTGLGYELSTAVEKNGKPTLALAQTNALVTRLVLGINEPCYTFARYETLEEIPLLVKQFIAGKV